MLVVFLLAFSAPNSIFQPVSSPCADPGSAEGAVFLFAFAVQGTASNLATEQYM